ncbi:MAG: hypothetical protein IH568_00285 [Burkholderiaceae bacterium]|jgi:hypothetical protein|nr:hypothetical protein [Burkholderiaceae bacterium]MBE0599732.1 hypothetical protein [Burkholderiaceae bacterium]
MIAHGGAHGLLADRIYAAPARSGPGWPVQEMILALSWLALGLGLAVFDILVTFFDILETGVLLG